MAKNPFQVVRIFEPQGTPALGMRSAPAPSSLKLGMFAQMTNWRFGDSWLKTRDGMKKLTSAVPVASATFCGAWQGYLRGTFTIVAAYRVSSYTRVYSLDPSSFAWTEITDDGTDATYGAKYGNTRFATAGNVNFTVIRDGSQVEYLLCQNGLDDPRIYDPSAVTHTKMRKHLEITVPTASAGQRVQLAWDTLPNYQGVSAPPSYASSTSVAVTGATNASPIVMLTASTAAMATGDVVGIRDVGGNTNANGIWPITVVDGTHFSLDGSTGNAAYTAGGYYEPKIAVVDNGYGPSKIATLSIPKKTVANDYGDILWNYTVNTFTIGGKQFTFAIDGDALSFINSVKIEAYDASGYIANHKVTLWDPSAGTAYLNPVVVAASGTTSGYVVAFSMDNITQPSLWTDGSRLRFTWVGSGSPPSDIAITFYGIAPSVTGIRGGANWGISWTNSGSRAESYGNILQFPSTDSTISGPTGYANTFNHVGLFETPNSTQLYYKVYLNYKNVVTAQIQAGVDTLNVYRQDYGESNYTLAYSVAVNAFSAGAWVTTTASTVLQTYDTTDPADKDISRTIPDTYHQCIQKATSILSNGGRLFLGGVGTNSNEVWVSEQDDATRFRPIVRYLDPATVDQTSPTWNAFPSEIVTGLAATSGWLVGVAPTLIFTSQSVWRLDGIDASSLSQPTKIASQGCLWPRTIAEHQGYIYWLDSESQVRVMRGSSVIPASKFKVDDKLMNATLSNPSGVWFGDKYYLNYTTTNTLIFEEIFGEWCEDHLAAGDVAMMIPVATTTGRKVYVFGATGHVYQYEYPDYATDDGVAFTAALTTREYHDAMWNRVFCENSGIVCDSGTSVLDVTHTWRGTNVNNDGTIDLNNATDATAWLWESGSNSIKPGGAGLGFQVTLSGALPNQFSLYSWVVKMAKDTDADANVG